MRPKLKNQGLPRIWRYGMGGVLLAATPLLDHSTAAAPPAIGNPNIIIANPAPPQAPAVPQWQMEQPDEMDVFQPAEQEAGAQNPLPQIFRYGPFDLHPHADYQITYGNGIQSGPGSAQQTFIQQLSPGILINLGRHWALDYTPTFMFYSSDKFKDGVDHSVSLNGAFQYEAWKFGFSHSSLITSAPTVQTAGQTDQTSHSTGFSANRILNSVLSADFGLNQQILLISGYQNSYDWSTVDWINYTFTPQLNAGLGAGAGYVLIEDNGQNSLQQGAGNGDQTYELVQARVNWRATAKLSFQVSGGLEDRQFMTGGEGDSLNPIFSAAIQYQPAQTTQLALTASRTVASSDYYLAAQQTETTVVGLSLTQKLFRRFSLGTSLAYALTDYSGSGSSSVSNQANRTDDLVTFNIRLTHPLFKRGTWSLFYQYSHDTSSQAGYSFDSNQEGFEVSYSF